MVHEEKVFTPLMSDRTAIACTVFLLGACGLSVYFELSWIIICLRLCFGFAIIWLARFLHTIPWLYIWFMVYKKDVATMANHWAEDRDLILLQRFIIGAYMLCASLFFYSCLLGYTMTQEELMEITRQPEWVYTFLPVKLLEYAGYVYALIALVVFVANTHVIFYRNTPTQNGVLMFCKECVRLGAQLGTGLVFSVGITGHLTASTPLCKTTMLANFVNTYSPFGQGYGYDIGTTAPHFCDIHLKSVPGYHSQDHIHPKTGNLDTLSVHRWIKENIREVRHNVSVGNLQTMNIDPTRISKYK